MLRERAGSAPEDDGGEMGQLGAQPSLSVDEFEDEAADLATVAAAIPDEASSLIYEAERVEALHISRSLEQAMAAKGLALPRALGPDLRDILRIGWSLAGLLHSRMATPLHLFAALSTARSGRGGGLANVVGAQPEWVFAGAVVRMALLRTAAQPTAPGHIAAPSIDLMRWVAEASRYAVRQNAGALHLEPDDLVLVLSCPHADPKVKQRIKDLLQEAANVGREPSEYVMTRHDVESAHRTVRYFRSETRQALQQVQAGLGTLGSDVKVLTGTISPRPDQPPGPGNVLTASSMVGDLVALGGSIRNDLVQLEERQAFRMGSTCKAMHDVVSTTAAEQVGRLAGIEQRTAAIEQKLPAPPTGRWLATAVAAVILLGALAGFVLSTGGR